MREVDTTIRRHALQRLVSLSGVRPDGEPASSRVEMLSIARLEVADEYVVTRRLDADETSLYAVDPLHALDLVRVFVQTYVEGRYGGLQG